jgi:Ran GTPase-activating protein 1
LDARAVTELAAAITAHGEKLVDLELNGNYGEDGTEEQYEKVREALEKWGNGEALDELDELEEQDEDEEDEASDEEAEAASEEEEEAEAKAPGAPVEQGEAAKETDDLSSLLEKAHIA